MDLDFPAELAAIRICGQDLTADVQRHTVTSYAFDGYREFMQKKYSAPAGFNPIWKKRMPTHAPSLRGEVMKVLPISARPISADHVETDRDGREIVSVPELWSRRRTHGPPLPRHNRAPDDDLDLPSTEGFGVVGPLSRVRRLGSGRTTIARGIKAA